MAKLKALFPRDYRHYICITVTLLFMGIGFLFPNALPRVAESVRDLATSIAYYFMRVVSRGYNPIRPTVNAMPKWEWAEEIWEPLRLFPWTWEEFKVLWVEYWELWATWENVEEFFYYLGDVAYIASQYLMIIVPLIPVLIMKIKSYTAPVPKPKKKGKSKQLKRFEGFLFNAIYPVIAWIKDFVFFLSVNDKYPKAWLTLWLLHFNVLTIGIEAFAYFFYFAVSWDVLGLYTQVLKLLHDLTPMIRFFPGIVWLLIGIYIYNYICRSMAFTRLYHEERCNRAFLNERGIVTTVYGEMGTGKTQLITSMALSAEVQQWDDAFKILLECYLKFPNFPWQNLRDYIKREVRERRLCDLDAVRARFATFQHGFDWMLDKGFTPKTWKAYRKANKKLLKTDFTFGYDFEHYRHTYNDELKITHLYEVLADYACAYLVFTVRTSLIFANYSIRVDSIIRDIGNMPQRDNDFFNREPVAYKALKRHCHIINMDMLRLGKRMQKEFKLSFGVYVITEIDKERKNSVELQEEKKKQEDVNQKNDLFNACLMMCRHAAVISNRVFIRIICDLQRPEAWGAGGRELGEVIYIEEKGKLAPALPFFSPYWLTESLFSWVRDKWYDFRDKYDFERRDGTLFDYLVTNGTSMINNHYDKVNGLFGHFTLSLQIQSGRMDGEVKKGRWFILTKKDRANRYKTDCLSSVFHTYEPNTMHVDDFICFAGDVGTLAENGLQNSYFQNDIRDMHQKAA